MRLNADIHSVIFENNRRWTQQDPILPKAPALPDPSPGDLDLIVEGGVGIVRTHVTDLASFAASWTPARTSELFARVADLSSMDLLLSQWEKRQDDFKSTQADAQAVITWPSRDTGMAPVFLDHNFVPRSILAACPAGRQPSGSSDILVRPLAKGDQDAAATLWLEVIRWDSQFAAMTVRRSTEANIQKELTQALEAEHPWTWVAEDQGQLVGLGVVEPPERAGWVAPRSLASPTAYVTCLGVSAGHRGTGIGTSLVQTVHRALQEEKGVRATLLHYAALSPLSGPFWHRCGYRPLWTTWARPPRLP